MVVAAFLLVLLMAGWPSVAGTLLPQGTLSGIKITLSVSCSFVFAFWIREYSATFDG